MGPLADLFRRDSPPRTPKRPPLSTLDIPLPAPQPLFAPATDPARTRTTHCHGPRAPYNVYDHPASEGRAAQTLRDQRARGAGETWDGCNRARTAGALSLEGDFAQLTVASPSAPRTEHSYPPPPQFLPRQSSPARPPPPPFLVRPSNSAPAFYPPAPSPVSQRAHLSPLHPPHPPHPSPSASSSRPQLVPLHAAIQAHRAAASASAPPTPAAPVPRPPPPPYDPLPPGPPLRPIPQRPTVPPRPPRPPPAATVSAPPPLPPGVTERRRPSPAKDRGKARASGSSIASAGSEYDGTLPPPSSVGRGRGRASGSGSGRGGGSPRTPGRGKPPSSSSSSSSAAARASPASPSKASTSTSTPRRRVPSSSSAPSTPTRTAQCAALTARSARCTRRVPLRFSPSSEGAGEAGEEGDGEGEEEEVAYCAQHARGALVPSGAFVRSSAGAERWVRFADWIPEDLPAETQAQLRHWMARSVSERDCEGFIYVHELVKKGEEPALEAGAPALIKLGRSLRPLARLSQWRASCPSREPLVRGFFPPLPAPAERGGGRNHHRWERLCLLELAGRAGAGAGAQGREACGDCTRVHVECFLLPRGSVSGSGSEGAGWSVRETVERWGRWCDALG